MRRFKKLAASVIVLLAVVAAVWWALRAGDPSGFAKGTRVELTEFKGPDPTGAPPSLASADVVV